MFISTFSATLKINSMDKGKLFGRADMQLLGIIANLNDMENYNIHVAFQSGRFLVPTFT